MKEYIWGDAKLNELVERFTTKSDVGIERGSDYHLLPYAIQFEKAYIEFIYRQGKLDKEEFIAVSKKLDEALDNADLSNYEDLHSYIEDVVKTSLGRSIYICRSRNDVITAIERLYLRDALKILVKELYNLSKSLLKALDRAGDIPAPAHTHYVLADVIPLKAYFLSYLEELYRIIGFIPNIHKIIYTSPIGSGAIGGCPLNIDFTWLNRYLEFEDRHVTSIDGVNSRKTHNLHILILYSQLTGLIARISRDMIRLSTQYKILELPKEYTTGSSQLIHKINPDILELMIGLHRHLVSTLAAAFQHYAEESGYQRFLQLDKYNVIKYTEDVIASVKILSGLIENVIIHETFKGIEELKLTWLAAEIAWRYDLDYRKIYKLMKDALSREEPIKSIIKRISRKYSINQDELRKLSKDILNRKYNNSIMKNPSTLIKKFEDLFKNLLD